MCGYFVMRYMRDIIANRSLLTSQVYLPMYFHKYMRTYTYIYLMFHINIFSFVIYFSLKGKKTYSQAELDEVRSEWVSFFSTLILD